MFVQKKKSVGCATPVIFDLCTLLANKSCRLQSSPAYITLVSSYCNASRHINSSLFSQTFICISFSHLVATQLLVGMEDIGEITTTKMWCISTKHNRYQRNTCENGPDMLGHVQSAAGQGSDTIRRCTYRLLRSIGSPYSGCVRRPCMSLFCSPAPWSYCAYPYTDITMWCLCGCVWQINVGYNALWVFVLHFLLL